MRQIATLVVIFLEFRLQLLRGALQLLSELLEPLDDSLFGSLPLLVEDLRLLELEAGNQVLVVELQALRDSVFSLHVRLNDEQLFSAAVLVRRQLYFFHLKCNFELRNWF